MTGQQSGLLTTQCTTYRVEEDQGNAGKAAHKTDKLVEVASTGPGNASAKQNHEETEKVLLPLNERVVLASSAEQLLAGNLNSWINLQRRREQDGKGVDELHRIDEPVVLWHIEQNDGLCLGAKCSI